MKVILLTVGLVALCSLSMAADGASYKPATVVKVARSGTSIIDGVSQ